MWNWPCFASWSQVCVCEPKCLISVHTNTHTCLIVEKNLLGRAPKSMTHIQKGYTRIQRIHCNHRFLNNHLRYLNINSKGQCNFKHCKDNKQLELRTTLTIEISQFKAFLVVKESIIASELHIVKSPLLLKNHLISHKREISRSNDLLWSKFLLIHMHIMLFEGKKIVCISHVLD